MISAALSLPISAHADETANEAIAESVALDLELLEFLGSWEGDDADWLDLVDLAEHEVEKQLTASTVDGAEAAEDEE